MSAIEFLLRDHAVWVPGVRRDDEWRRLTLRQRFVGEMDHEFAAALDVDQGVLFPAVRPPVDRKHAERWILAEYVEEAERRGIDHSARADTRHPGDRPRQHERRQHLVAFAPR